MVLVCVAGGYAAFLSFFIREGRRYFKVHAEMQLAHEIHQVLVPPIALRLPEYEIVGFSQPSGEVGGDLVDVVESGAGWVAYLADVSGHGVAPGVVLNPATPLEFLDEVLQLVSVVLIMSVNPGFGGQKFIPRSLDRFRRLAET